MKSWPFQEAKKLLARVEKTPLRKQVVTFATGFGPSGAPHIGTFAEVVRTQMVLKAFEHLVDGEHTTRLVVFSDDYDALRSIPTDVPNPEMLTEDLGLPLTRVRDPFEVYDSFGARNNALLQDFLHKMGMEGRYEFRSATETYQAGRFNIALGNVLLHEQEILDIMLPTLGAERRATYSPFLPVSPKTGRVLQVPTRTVDLMAGLIEFQDEDGESHTVFVGNGNTKLQWKVDWAMRWGAFGVDYEMSGKDLTDSYKASAKIARVLGHEPPVNLTYELFLDKDGHKISKSKGNGLTVGEWTRYGTHASLSYYMFQSPTSAKQLHTGVIPRAMDDYLKSLKTFWNQSGDAMLDNPVWHVHWGDPPFGPQADISYGLLVNMASASPGIDELSLASMLGQYRKPSASDAALFGPIVGRALNYCTDIVFPDKMKRMRAPTDQERDAFRALADRLEGMENGLEPEAYQFEVYEIGKANGYADDLRSWFRAIYEVLFGDEQGPRFGSFIAAFGRSPTIKMLRDACA